MNQYLVMATLVSEDTAERFLNSIVRRGVAFSALREGHDPIVPGGDCALVVLTLTSDKDLPTVYTLVKACLAPIAWQSMVVLPAEGVTSMRWTANGHRKSPPLAIAPSPEEATSFNEAEWFEAGDKLLPETVDVDQ